jgi:hypothetical protein
MAYGAKYIVEFSDIFSNTPGDYTATIYKKDYTGSSYDVSCSGTPLTIETDRGGDAGYRGVIGSKATLNLVIRDSDLPIYWADVDDTWDATTLLFGAAEFSFTEFLTAEIDTFYLEVLKGADVVWRGYYIPTTDISINEITPIDFSLVFSDLNLLKSSLYQTTTTDDEIAFYAHEQVSLKDLVINALYSANLFAELRINFPFTFTQPDGQIDNSGVTSDKTIQFEDIYILKNGLLKSPGEYLDYYTILEGICNQFGLMMYQRNGYLYVTSYDGLMNSTSRVYKRYASSGGTYIADVTESDSPIAVNSSTFKNVGQDQIVRYALPYKYLDVTSKPSRATNNINGSMWGFDYSASPTTKSLSGWYGVGVGTSELQLERAVYKTSSTSPYNYKFGLKVKAASTDPVTSRQYRMTTPVSVNAGDKISGSFKYSVDADDSYDASETRMGMQVVLNYRDADGVDRTYYLQVTNLGVATWGSSSTRVVYLNVPTPLSLNYAYAQFKNVTIPYSGTVEMRLFAAYNSDWVAGSSIYAYVNYAFLQTYKGESLDQIPNTQKSRSYYSNLNNNKDILELQTVGYIFNGTPLQTFANETLDKSYAAVVGNCLTTDQYDYIHDNYVTGEDRTQKLIGESIQKNIGILNTAIEGAYKSDIYTIGQKFTYTITGFEEKTFVLLDYKTDFINKNQNCTLYSAQFTDTTSLTFNYQILTE